MKQRSRLDIIALHFLRSWGLAFACGGMFVSTMLAVATTPDLAEWVTAGAVWASDFAIAIGLVWGLCAAFTRTRESAAD